MSAPAEAGIRAAPSRPPPIIINSPVGGATITHVQHLHPPATSLHRRAEARRPVKVAISDAPIPPGTGSMPGSGWHHLLVGTMLCGYVFAAIALISLPSAIKSHNSPSSSPGVEQLPPAGAPAHHHRRPEIQAAAADKRSEATYNDADAVLHEALQIQKHLEAQDTASRASLHVGGPAPPARLRRRPVEASAARPCVRDGPFLHPAMLSKRAWCR